MIVKIETNENKKIIAVHYDTDSSVRDNEFILEIEDNIDPRSLLGKMCDGGTISDFPRSKDDRYKRLENIFSKKTIGLKKIAIDKPWMNDTEAINNQYRVYEEMYKNALKGLYDSATNQSIITANETAKAQLAQITLLLNTVRSTIENAIATDDPNADNMLDAAEAVSLTIQDLTDENINKIKATFGIN